jgi:hypothetical protein
LPAEIKENCRNHIEDSLYSSQNFNPEYSEYHPLDSDVQCAIGRRGKHNGEYGRGKAEGSKKYVKGEDVTFHCSVREFRIIKSDLLANILDFET